LGKLYLFVILCLIKHCAVLYELWIVHGHVIEQMEDELCLLRGSLAYSECHGP
jgi:hypothetical protein